MPDNLYVSTPQIPPPSPETLHWKPEGSGRCGVCFTQRHGWEEKGGLNARIALSCNHTVTPTAATSTASATATTSTTATAAVASALQPISPPRLIVTALLGTIIYSFIHRSSPGSTRHYEFGTFGLDRTDFPPWHQESSWPCWNKRLEFCGKKRMGNQG